MNVLLALFSIFTICGLRFNKSGNLEKYISHDTTQTVNGIFVVFFFISHFNTYISPNDLNRIEQTAVGFLGQFIVTTFLFYSGFGIMFSIKNKENYCQEKLPKRFFALWMSFSIAVLFYLLVAIIRGDSYPILKIMLSFIALDSIGNSNWFIFATLYLYICVIVLSKIIADSNFERCLVFGVLICSVVYILCMGLLNKGTCFFDTILCFPAGMIWKLFQEPIERYLKRSSVQRIFCTFISTVIVLICRVIAHFTDGWISLSVIEIANVFFAITVVLFTTWVEIRNRLFHWLGTFAFEIYILQRIPMIVFKDVIRNDIIYFVTCFILTVFLAKPFHILLNKMRRVFISA